MRRHLLYTVIIVFAALHGVQAQDSCSCSDAEFRSRLRSVVSEGNREYDRSSRSGIARMADSLENMLMARSRCGRLDRTDSLEFTADLLKLRGDWHYENSNYDTASYDAAESCFLQALDIYAANRNFDGQRQYAPMIWRELAQLYYKREDYAQALRYIMQAHDAFETAVDNGEIEPDDAEFLMLKSQLAICHARVGASAAAVGEIDEVLRLCRPSGEEYYETLRKKGKIIMLTEGPAAEAQPYYKAYLEWRKGNVLEEFAGRTAVEREEFWMRMRPFFADCCQLEDADAGFLYDAALFSKALLLHVGRIAGRDKAGSDALKGLQYQWRDVQSRLPEDGCAIEFVQYEKRGERLLGAIVLRKKGQPQWVSMMKPEDFMTYTIEGRTNRERIYSSAGKIKNAMYEDVELHHRLWNDGLCAAIGDSRKIYFAPDGYLHQLAVEYMLPEELEGAEVYRLTSTRRLMESAEVRTGAALIVGGVKYNSKDAEEATGGNDREAYASMRAAHARFEYLPYSMVECDSIRSSRRSVCDLLLTGSAATESAFLELCGRYPIVSVSTHGYFGSAEVPQGTDLKPCLSDESLSQSVIALAGANVALADAGFDADRADGIVSAREIADADMRNVDLAVISACQTGLGYVTADGIYGIQRGFKSAGAGSLLVSLWNVDDRASCMLVAGFHRNLSHGMPLHEAFAEARRELMRSGSDAKRSVEFNPRTLAHEVTNEGCDYSKPQYCNAFVMIDAIE